MSIELLIPSNHLILCHLLLLLPSIFPSTSLFQWVGSSHQVGKILKLQHQSFQKVCRVDSLSFQKFDWLTFFNVPADYIYAVCLVWAMKSKCNFHIILKILAFFFNYFSVPVTLMFDIVPPRALKLGLFFFNLCSSVLQINNFHISALNLLTFYTIPCNLLKHSVFLNFC